MWLSKKAKSIWNIKNNKKKKNKNYTRKMQKCVKTLKKCLLNMLVNNQMCLTLLATVCGFQSHTQPVKFKYQKVVLETNEQQILLIIIYI